MKLKITKTINPARLQEELSAAFLGAQTAVEQSEEEGSWVYFPDGTDAALVQQVIDLHDTSVQSEADKARDHILSLAKSAAGVRLQDLTAAQVKALTACMLHMVGGVNPKTMTVKPLGEWLK